MTAIAIAFGISTSEFNRLLLDNNQRMQELRADDPFVDAIKNFMVSKKEINDAVSAVYAAVRESLVGSKVNFPQSPSAFSRRMREEREALWSVGIEFIIKDGAECNKITIINSNLRRRKKQK